MYYILNILNFFTYHVHFLNFCIQILHKYLFFSSKKEMKSLNFLNRICIILYYIISHNLQNKYLMKLIQKYIFFNINMKETY